MPTRTLDQWLDYQLQQHPKAIALGLERTRTVADRLGVRQPAARVISVAGTNGKGSTVAFLEACARAAGWRTGAFTSPHVLRYNERIRLDGEDVDDARLLAAFKRIDAARGDIPLTFFEFGTLTALQIFAESALDLAILEVGLGGRLDAVNVVDADIAVITTIDLDHTDWLGETRDLIGAEKAGIARPGRLAVIGDRDAPEGLLNALTSQQARTQQLGRDFDNLALDSQHWHYRDGAVEWTLPTPALAADCQRDNAACAVRALRELGLSEAACRQGIGKANAKARLQQVATAPDILLDVAHNPQAATQLARWLEGHPINGDTLAVFAALGDKDAAGIVARLGTRVDHWHLAGLQVAGRSQSAAALHARIGDWPGLQTLHDTVASALAAARHGASERDRILVFGSFHTVAEAWQALLDQGQRL
ncbi:MAG: bifunctional tetrahydrofolate synthase/dihydrofolate synthase [Lysobacteraceae bacterium]